jgi:CheY-like chemotaxis protein
MCFKKKILIVDDTPENIQLLEEFIFKGQHIDIFKANGGRAAVRLLADNNFDLVLLDLVMPDMNGLEVLEKMNQLEGEKPPVIILSSEDNFHVIEKAYSLGVKSYLVYPLNVIRLNKEIEKILMNN